MKGGITIPNTNFITTLLNVSTNDIDSLVFVKQATSIHYYLTLIKPNLECPHCASSFLVSHGFKVKKIKHDPIKNFDGFIFWKARRFKCKDCGITFLEPNRFTMAGFSTSYATMMNVMKDLKNLHMSYKDVAIHNHISITQVQRYFDSFINFPRLSLPVNIGIDELHSNMAKYGSAYLCTFVDNEKRTLFELLPSRSKLSLDRYFEKIPQIEKDKVLYVTIDMWLPYKDIAIKHFNNCQIAVDPFHVVKHLMQGFARLRINLMNQVEYGSTSYYLLKTWHRLIDSDVYLDNEPVYNSRFKRKVNKRDLHTMLLDINENLALAYQLKERYRIFNASATKANCEESFNYILQLFQEANIPEYYNFIVTITNWKAEILNSFKRPHEERKQSNALAENINSQIRSYLAISRGNTNFERFRKRMIYALNRKIFYSITDQIVSLKQERKAK